MFKRIFSRKNRILLMELVRTDFKLRYQGSFLGYLWTLLKPLLLFVILYIVFTKFLKIGAGIPNYALSLLLGVVLWSFFVEATSQSLKSIVANGSLIRKINIPRYMIPIAAVISAFINMLLNLVVVFIFVLFAQNIAVSWLTLLVFPALIIEITVIAVGAGLYLAALYVRFRDLDHIWEVIKQALFYTVPIIYPLTRISSITIKKLIMLDPLAEVIQQARSVVTYAGTPTISDVYGRKFIFLVPISFAIAIFLVGAIKFRKEAKLFAENA